MQPIYTQTIASGSVYSVTFNNIPQTFTDLMLDVSYRTTGSNAFESLTGSFNLASDSLHSTSYIQGYSGSPSSGRSSGLGYFNFGYTSGGGSATATFGNAQIYIPNYTSSNYKAVMCESTQENNSTSNYVLTITANLWRNTAAITQIQIASTGILAANSTISLYGITKG